MQRCVGVFFRSGESREQCRLSGARHSPERAHGKARAAQPLAAKSPERERGRVKGSVFARAKRSLV